jgi:hypothetical protein
MDTLLARLERRFGRYAIEGLVTYLAMATGAASILGYFRNEVLDRMALVPALVRHGQPWRLFSFMLEPLSDVTLPINLALELFLGVGFLIWMGQAIEASWGSFRLSAFVIVSWLATTMAAMASGYPMSNFFVMTSLALVGATLFPTQEISVFGVVPVAFKWLGLMDFAYMIVVATRGNAGSRIGFAVAIAIYFLFCGGMLRGYSRGPVRDWTSVKRAPARASEPPPSATPTRACTICGLTDADEGADLRVCTCKEVCGGKPTVYCLAHAKSHRVVPG